MRQEEMKLYLDRCRRFLRRCEPDLLSETIIPAAEFARTAEPVRWEERETLEYRPIDVGGDWGEAWDSAWFRLRAQLPESWKDRPVALQLNLSGESLIFDADGLPLCATTGNSLFNTHYTKEFFQVPESLRRGGTVDLWIEAAANSIFGVYMDEEPHRLIEKPAGYFPGKVKVMRIGLFNTELWHLRIELELLLNYYDTLPENDYRRRRLLAAMNETVNLYADDPANAAKAREPLAKMLALPALASALKVSAVGHAHIDTGWLWPVRETVRKCARTFANQLDMMDKYPGYVFGASQPQHYAFVKEHYPKLYEKIKQRVAEGRWELQGGMWVEADCNLISGESMVRQFLHGKNFYMDEFGFDVKNLWIPDVFGYSAALPQIIRKSGCDFFLTQKISWNQFNRFPHNTFFWEGIDGSEVLTHFPPEDTYNAFVVPEELVAAQNRFKESDLLDEFISLFGIGDGGGGPKEEYLERAKRLANLEGCPKVKFGRADRFFERIAACRDKLPTWSGELYLELHRGTLTVQARTKRNNRKLEELLATVEFAHSLLPLSEYPAEALDRIWKTLLINQFHDIIPGSSIRKVYETTEREHAEALEAAARLAGDAVRKLGRAASGAVTLVNSLSVPQDDPVVLPAEWDGSAVLDASGSALPAQIEDGRVVAAVTVPADALTVLARGAGRAPACEPLEGRVLENGLIRYEFDADGRLTRAFDKEAGREVLPPGAAGNEFSLYVERANNHEAWDIEIFYEQQKCGTAKSIEPARGWRGPVRSGLEFRLGIGNSRLVQRVTLAEGSKRLDFATEAEWHEERKMLRVAFPVAVFTEEANFDIQYGTVRRPTHRNTSWDAARFEVCGQKFADLSEEFYGAALLNDCKYGYKVFGTTLDLCLLRAPKFPDWDADQGHHEFIYSFLPHTGSLNNSGVRSEAAKLNRPALAVPGVAAEAVSPLSLEAATVALTVVKKAEKEDCLVIRLVEQAGRNSQAVLTVPAGKRLVGTNLLEWTNDDVLTPEAGTVALTFRPYEIKTFKVV